MKNKYEIRGNVTAIIIHHSQLGRIEALIDTDDLPKAKNISGTWCAYKATTNGLYYVCGYDKGERPRLHSIIMNFPEKLMVDHINNNPLDNRKENLRLVTNAVNSQNRKGASKNNISSGYRNVTYHKASNSWGVRITKNGKRYSFGYYKDIEKANEVAAKARIELFGKA